MFEKFTVEIRLGNAAFEGDNLTYELAAALREVADRLENDGPRDLTVHDVNGNRVGAARFHNVNHARKDES